MPAVGMGKSLHEPGHAQVGETRYAASGSESGGRQSPDPPAVIAAVEIEELLDLRRDRPRVFDRLAVHVADIKRAVRSVGEIDGAEPVVAGGEKLALLFVGRSLGHALHAARHDLDPLVMDEVPTGVADKGVSHVLLAEGVAFVDRDAGRAGEV